MSSFLLGKGFTQKVKTVYSPVTQIRNVTSAALFAGRKEMLVEVPMFLNLLRLFWRTSVKLLRKNAQLSSVSCRSLASWVRRHSFENLNEA